MITANHDAPMAHPPKYNYEGDVPAVGKPIGCIDQPLGVPNVGYFDMEYLAEIALGNVAGFFPDDLAHLFPIPWLFGKVVYSRFISSSKSSLFVLSPYS
jgi:hypothetical protein